MTNHTTQVAPGLSLYYSDTNAAGDPILLLHSLSDNGHAFDAILDQGLTEHYRCIIPDLRGRGRSDRPQTGYTLDDHVSDLIALLDHLGLWQVAVAGHSFGGLLGLYFAYKHPERVSRLALIDAAIELHPMTPVFLLLMTDRLGRWYPSPDSYIMSIRATPFMTYWSSYQQTMMLADTMTLPDSVLRVKTLRQHIAQVAADVYRIRKEDWRNMALHFRKEALVLSAEEPFLSGQHIVPEPKAVETAVFLPRGIHEIVPGNHVTMLFKGAPEIHNALVRWMEAPAWEPAALATA